MMTSVDLSDRRLKYFQADNLSSKAKMLDCSHNCLQTTDGFQQMQLISLDLSSNMINKLCYLPSTLIDLNLSHNRLGETFSDFKSQLRAKGTRMYVGSFFSNLTRLRTLNLSANGISFLASELFEDLTSLQILNLSKNKLNSPLWSFAKLSLSELDLSNNQLSLNDLKPLEKVVFGVLKLQYNPLESNSDINQKLSHILKETSVVFFSTSKMNLKISESIMVQSTHRTPTKNRTLSQITESRVFIPNDQEVSFCSDSLQQSQITRRTIEQHTPTKDHRNKENTTPTKLTRVYAQFTPTKQPEPKQQRQNLKKSSQQHTPRKDQRTTILQDKSTVKPVIPLLELKHVGQIHSFSLSDDEEDEELKKQRLQQEYKQLGLKLKEIKQRQVQTEREILVNKNMIQLTRLAVRQVYLHQLEYTTSDFDRIMDEIEAIMLSGSMAFGDLKLQLLVENDKLQLTNCVKQVTQSQMICEQLKQL